MDPHKPPLLSGNQRNLRNKPDLRAVALKSQDDIVLAGAEDDAEGDEDRQHQQRAEEIQLAKHRQTVGRRAHRDRKEHRQVGDDEDEHRPDPQRQRHVMGNEEQVVGR